MSDCAENGSVEGTLECGSASYRRPLEFQCGSSAAALHAAMKTANGRSASSRSAFGGEEKLIHGQIYKPPVINDSEKAWAGSGRTENRREPQILRGGNQNLAPTQRAGENGMESRLRIWTNRPYFIKQKDVPRGHGRDRGFVHPTERLGK